MNEHYTSESVRRRQLANACAHIVVACSIPDAVVAVHVVPRTAHVPRLAADVVGNQSYAVLTVALCVRLSGRPVLVVERRAVHPSEVAILVLVEEADPNAGGKMETRRCKVLRMTIERVRNCNCSHSLPQITLFSASL